MITQKLNNLVTTRNIANITRKLTSAVLPLELPFLTLVKLYGMTKGLTAIVAQLFKLRVQMEAQETWFQRIYLPITVDWLRQTHLVSLRQYRIWRSVNSGKPKETPEFNIHIYICVTQISIALNKWLTQNFKEKKFILA